VSDVARPDSPETLVKVLRCAAEYAVRFEVSRQAFFAKPTSLAKSFAVASKSGSKTSNSHPLASRAVSLNPWIDERERTRVQSSLCAIPKGLATILYE
jgi:hypothetical protein